ncbi:MAG TPA: hypothetical protein VM261_16225 [Kofleriaceae bacterium]|nr:hypothetical protein [Kofleriaceae bacterium]
MRTLKIVVLALGLASFATACGKKKDTSTPATEPAADGASGSGDTANPCGGGEGDTAPNPCNPCGGAADPCGGGE